RPRARRRLVVRRFGGFEVRVVVAGPAPLLRVPPDVRLARAPRPPGRVGGGPVVEDAPVGRPRPPPLRRHPGLLRTRPAAGRLVDLAGVAATVDPAAAGGRPVVGELGER